MIAEIWTDAVEMGAAARIGRGRAQALRMMRTDAFHLLVLFRLRTLMRRWHIPLLNRHLRLCQMMFGGVELGDDVTIGRGVYFVHSLGTVVGGTARIGNRVRFMGNNTVGTARDNGYPVIEDDVELGAGARVLGPVRIGAGAVIGANSVVLSDIPDGAVAVGAPARVVRVAPRATVAAAGLRLLATREA